jgi:hypothetical protein
MLDALPAVGFYIMNMRKLWDGDPGRVNDGVVGIQTEPSDDRG